MAKLLREMWPGLAVLLATLIIATFIAEFTFTSGGKAAGFVLWRFLRLFLILTLPLFLLPVVCAGVRRVSNWNRQQFIRVTRDENRVFQPVQSWVFRPLQGIGLVMLLATRLLALAGEYLSSSFAGPAIPQIPPPGEFTMGRFMSLTITSLLLSFIWTMDDLGIRSYKRKTGEIRMVGKYLGSILPILSGFYGVYSLFKNQPPMRAVLIIAQMVIIFYPPLVMFIVLHGVFVKKYTARLLGRLNAAYATPRVDVEP